MKSFNARVELREGSARDYGRLADEMGRKGFQAAITSSKGVTYRLPTGTFIFAQKATATQVIDLAREAAATMRKEAAILVSEVSNRAWDNLAAVRVK